VSFCVGEQPCDGCQEKADGCDSPHPCPIDIARQPRSESCDQRLVLAQQRSRVYTDLVLCTCRRSLVCLYQYCSVAAGQAPRYGRSIQCVPRAGTPTQARWPFAIRQATSPYPCRRRRQRNRPPVRIPVLFAPSCVCRWAKGKEGRKRGCGLMVGIWAEHRWMPHTTLCVHRLAPLHM
jgi:hypothetical protein